MAAWRAEAHASRSEQPPNARLPGQRSCRSDVFSSKLLHGRQKCSPAVPQQGSAPCMAIRTHEPPSCTTDACHPRARLATCRCRGPGRRIEPRGLLSACVWPRIEHRPGARAQADPWHVWGCRPLMFQPGLTPAAGQHAALVCGGATRPESGPPPAAPRGARAPHPEAMRAVAGTQVGACRNGAAPAVEGLRLLCWRMISDGT